MKLHSLLQTKKVLLSDGACGTEIAKYAFPPGTCNELINLTEPSKIIEIARRYSEAGSDVILTNTFGGSPQKLSKYGLESRTFELNEAGIRISREAAGVKALVMGTIGPTGEFLEPLGALTEKDLIKSFAIQVKAFVSAGADAVLIESMSDLGETLCALKAARDNSDFEAVCSLTFDKGVHGYSTMMGVTPERAVSELEAAGADVVGSNCGNGIENIIEIARVMKRSTSLPLWFKPNAGLPELIGGKTVYRQTPETMASHLPKLINEGARFVGGCCGSTPEHISKFREVIDSLS